MFKKCLSFLLDEAQEAEAIQVLNSIYDMQEHQQNRQPQDLATICHALAMLYFILMDIPKVSVKLSHMFPPTRSGYYMSCIGHALFYTDGYSYGKCPSHPSPHDRTPNGHSYGKCQTDKHVPPQDLRKSQKIYKNTVLFPSSITFDNVSQ